MGRIRYQRDSGTVQFGSPILVRLPAPLRPSISRDTPNTPIGDIDVDQAERLLKNVSFKLGSHSLQRFLNRLDGRK